MTRHTSSSQNSNGRPQGWRLRTANWIGVRTHSSHLPSGYWTTGALLSNPTVTFSIDRFINWWRQLWHQPVCVIYRAGKTSNAQTSVGKMSPARSSGSPPRYKVSSRSRISLSPGAVYAVLTLFTEMVPETSSNNFIRMTSFNFEHPHHNDHCHQHHYDRYRHQPSLYSSSSMTPITAIIRSNGKYQTTQALVIT